jgi:hypothetical protein
MTDQLSALDSYCLQQLQAGAKPAPMQAPVKRPARVPPTAGFRRTELQANGMEVREERLATVTAQRMYKMRCECGRSWFELVCKQIVHCPACHQAGLVAD